MRRKGSRGSNEANVTFANRQCPVHLAVVFAPCFRGKEGAGPCLPVDVALAKWARDEIERRRTSLSFN